MNKVVVSLAVAFVLLVLLFVSVELFFGGVGALLARWGWTTIRAVREERGLPDSLREQGEVFRNQLLEHDAMEKAKEAARLLEQSRIFDAINKSVEDEAEDSLREEVLRDIDKVGQ